LEVKRSGLDGYNFEAKKSDKHSNDVYLSLINYYNGTLVSDYNTFVEFSARDGYYGLKIMNYIPLFEIRTQIKTVSVEVKPFDDIVHTSLNIQPQKNTLPRQTFTGLTNYIDFMNEALRQAGYLQLVLSNLNSSASYYKDLADFKGKGGLHFEYKNFELPLSLYQKTIEESKSISPPAVKSLNDQTEVLLRILKELDQISATIESEVSTRAYEKDNLNNLYALFERSKTLFEIFDDKKEQLYDDVRLVYESYPVQAQTNSWTLAGKALQHLVDLDHDALFKAKAYYKGNNDVKVSTEKIDQVLRDVISNEYTNMKGIERLGRYNGLCPYTPYEDLPQTSKILSEKLNTLKPVGSASGYQHPYHDMVYQYNDIADDLNKFSELSKEIFLLKTIKQPELFNVKYPGEKTQEQKLQFNNKPTTTEKATAEATKVATPLPAGKPKVIHDTIYIEKRDTVFIGGPDEDLHSMEGYAINNVILLLDISGSMNTPEKLPLLKKSVLGLLNMMRPEDEVAIVAYSGKAKVLLPSTSFKDADKIRKVIEKLKSEGKTDGNAGLKLAYKVADENYVRGGNNRIILATDGEFPISEEVFQLVEKFSNADIFISVFNFGKQTGSSKNLKTLSDSGKGNYEFITNQNVELKLIRELKAKKKK
jgi:Mg-chelatase subunit ChlD